MQQPSFVGAALIVWIGLTRVVSGQTESPAQRDIAKLIEKLSDRIEALEMRHQSDQHRIEALEERLKRLEQPATEEARAQEVEQIKEAVKQELGEPAASSGLLNLSSSGYGATNQLNPTTTVFIDTGASISSRGSNRAVNRFNLREVELDMRAAITPSIDGVVIVTLGEDIQSLRNGDINVDTDVDIEESYLNFHSLPYDLSLKVGKFRTKFGVNNLTHTHDLPQVTRPLALVNFLGSEGLISNGASLSWLVPNPWDKYIEATAEVFNADSGPDSPILGGPNADNPAVLVHVKYFDDISDVSSFEIGGSYLFAHSSSRSDFTSSVAGLDLNYLWIDPDPSKFHSFVFQSELFWANNDVDRGSFQSGRNSSFGAYAFGQYQLNRDLYVGLRGDYSEFPNSDIRGTSDYDVAIAPYVTLYITEFLRLRLEVQHRLQNNEFSSTSSEDAVFLQFTGVIGAHPPHPYWVLHR